MGEMSSRIAQRDFAKRFGRGKLSFTGDVLQVISVVGRQQKFAKLLKTAHCRRVAQLVRALLDTVEVRSSSLLVPTIFLNGLAILSPLFVTPKRSISGLSSCFPKSFPFSACSHWLNRSTTVILNHSD